MSRNPSAFLLFASADHVARGISQSIAQACHGKRAPLKRIAQGDWIIYYSAKWRYDNSNTGKTAKSNEARIFSAIGRVADSEPFSAECQIENNSSSSTNSECFQAWRRRIDYYPSIHSIPITPLINSLEFIKNKKHWGMFVRGGIISLNFNDFQLISNSMGINQIQRETFIYEIENRKNKNSQEFSQMKNEMEENSIKNIFKEEKNAHEKINEKKRKNITGGNSNTEETLIGIKIENDQNSENIFNNENEIGIQKKRKIKNEIDSIASN